jgi:hypothetical protein
MQTKIHFKDYNMGYSGITILELVGMPRLNNGV